MQIVVALFGKSVLGGYPYLELVWRSLGNKDDGDGDGHKHEVICTTFFEEKNIREKSVTKICRRKNILTSVEGEKGFLVKGTRFRTLL